MPRTYTQLHYHVVFATKDRAPVLDESVTVALHSLFGAIVRDQGGVVVAAGGMPDHVHLVLGLRAQTSLAEVVKAVKGASSHWINQHARCPERFAWQKGYAAFTVSHSVLPRVCRYVQNQERHHARLSVEAEWEQLLRRHGVTTDPRVLELRSSIPVPPGTLMSSE